VVTILKKAAMFFIIILVLTGCVKTAPNENNNTQTLTKDNVTTPNSSISSKIEEDKILGDKYPVTVSIGIASYPQHGQWKHELIEKADQALYIAKELGRNRSQVWSSEFSNKVKSTNILTGIISGNVVQDSRNVLVIAELIELIKSEASVKNKIYNALGRIIEITEAQNGFLFIVNDEKVVEKYEGRFLKRNGQKLKITIQSCLNLL
jgi:hypothetical protein